ncbi:unnamed protein product [Lota lota]
MADPMNHRDLLTSVGLLYMLALMTLQHDHSHERARLSSSLLLAAEARALLLQSRAADGHIVLPPDANRKHGHTGKREGKTHSVDTKRG